VLDWEKVATIRSRVAGGEPQASVARAFGISTGLCCQIIKGEIWNREKYKVGTKGDSMRLRLILGADVVSRRCLLRQKIACRWRSVELWHCE
jgi:hypothetical protein